MKKEKTKMKKEKRKPPKEKEQTLFAQLAQSLTEKEQQALATYFEDLNSHILLSKDERRRMHQDFESAIRYYLESGVSLKEALERLDPIHLGGFYARPPILWFPLDDAAKIYPLSMKHGTMALFRLSATLKAPVVPELLQIALTFTIKRFPSFATTLKKGFFWHYLDTTKRRFCIEPETEIPCRPMIVSHSGSQTFRVLYYEKRISVEFFHVLTDGTGGMTFLKVLLAEYLRLTGVTIEKDDTLWDADDTPTEQEYANAFPKVEKSASASGFMGRPASQLSGKLTPQGPCRVLHFQMSAAAIRKAASRYGCTITAYLLALMFLAAKAATDEPDGEINIQVPVNMRKFYPTPTVRNFSMYGNVRIPMGGITDIPGMMETIQQQMREKTSQEAMNRMLTAAVRMVDVLSWVPLFIKGPVASVVYGFLGDRIFTSALSNLGVVRMPPSMEAQLESMDFVLGTAITNRAMCALVTVGDAATLSITKMTADPSFEEKLYQLLRADGIEVQAEGSRLYEG
ncbi:MAG: hypothetical protein ACI3V3_07325 [Faecousia sp.]